MTQHYLDEARAADPHYLPNVEVFYVDGTDPDEMDMEGDPLPAGFYWWSCLPGCLPDSEPNGPHETEEEALADAREGLDA